MTTPTAKAKRGGPHLQWGNGVKTSQQGYPTFAKQKCWDGYAGHNRSFFLNHYIRNQNP